MLNETKVGFKNKGLLLIGCLLNLYQDEFVVKDIGFILLIIVSSLLIIYQPGSLMKALALIGTIVLAVFFSKYALFFPVLLYDFLERDKGVTYIIFPFIDIVLIVISYLDNFSVLAFYLFLGLMAIYLREEMEKSLKLSEDYRRLDLSSKEHRFLLEKQNFHLIEEQNLNLTLGIAEERNRISRDIHDNVGHLLSSSLIQIGALNVLNQDVKLEDPLNLLEATVQEGMDNIRDSVHNLHDDSLNLKESLLFIVDSFQEYSIEFHYDIKEAIGAGLKMDLLMIIRESLANVMKHSNGTKVFLEVVEQPAFYRVLIKDNGSNNVSKNPLEVGMGLNSMKERMMKQGGRLTAEQQSDGFQVLAIIPKESGEE